MRFMLLLLSPFALSSVSGFVISQGKNPFPTSLFQNQIIAAESTATTVYVSLTDEQRVARLQQALARDPSGAKALINELATLRSQSEAVRQAYVDDLLEAIPTKLPFWTAVPLTARVSKRSRWAALQRTLSLTTPTVNDGEEDTVEGRERRRRRAFVLLLQSLAGEEVKRQPAIRSLEKQARQESKVNVKDLVQRRPADLETPQYTVLQQKSNFEIRKYDPFSVCSVSVSTTRPVNNATDEAVASPEQPSSRAFGSLAGYLFGKNKEQQAMKMTTPVLMTGGENRSMSFVLPSAYWNGGKVAPEPLGGSGVRLEDVPGEVRAVVMFGGYASKNEVEQRKSQLRRYLAEQSAWKYNEEDVFAVAQYNDPFTPPWKRLNEVSLPVYMKS
jgi:hypothetical protein